MKQQTKLNQSEIGKNVFIGTWHITKMSEWDSEYCNMEVQAYIRIKKNELGEFQFGLVSGNIDGKKSGDTFEFTWDGSDECDDASGSGWMKIKDDGIEGGGTLGGAINDEKGKGST